MPGASSNLQASSAIAENGLETSTFSCKPEISSTGEFILGIVSRTQPYGISRGDDTILLFLWMERLRAQALKVGGTVLSHLGNHEWMNAIGTSVVYDVFTWF